jgi:hypothetical protein
LDVSDDSEQVMLEVVKDRGRGKFDVLAPAKIWDKRWGILELKDYQKKVQIEEDKAKLEADRKKDADRKLKEAKERGKVKKVVEEKRDAKKPVKVVSNNPSREEMENAKPVDAVIRKINDEKIDMGKELEL